MMFKVKIPYPINWVELTTWMHKNVIGNWKWMPLREASFRDPSNPGYFGFENEEDKVKFILKWL